MMVNAATNGLDDFAVSVYRAFGQVYGPDAAIEALAAMAALAAGPAKRQLGEGGAEFAGVAVLDENGELVDPAVVPYAVRWTGRMMAAAVADDSDLTIDLITAALDDGHMSECVAELARTAGFVVLSEVVA